MILEFETSGQIATGANPAAVHMSDNGIWAFRVQDGRLEGEESPQGPGDIDYSLLSWADFAVVTQDKNIDMVRLKNVPRLGVYGAWHQDPVLDALGQVITPQRHRFAIWSGGFDPSDMLIEGTVTFRLDSPIAQANFSFENPDGEMMGEDASLFHPGVEIGLEFYSGDTGPYPMGSYFVDRARLDVPSPDCSVECRNLTGKVLRDQTYDENVSYPKGVFSTVLNNIMANSGLDPEDYVIQQTPGYEVGMAFPNNMQVLDGLYSLLRTTLNWEIKERMDGKIVLGSVVSFTSEMPTNSKYTFNRGEDVFSRSIERDDMGSYSRVCVTSIQTDPVTEEKSELAVYEPVVLADMNWTIPPKKTLYVSAAEETTQLELADIAGDIAGRLATAGTVESFIGPFRPQLLCGDEAEIIGQQGTKLLGVITSITHRMGRNGYYTEFTVDSGGRLGKPMLSDYITSISQGSSMSKKPRRLW